MFIYLPVLAELSNPDGAMISNEQYLFKYCEERRILCLFLRQHFLEERKKGVEFNTRSHWLANEHMIAARGVKKCLIEKIWSD